MNEGRLVLSAMDL